MPTRSLTESYAISPQIAVKDVADLRAEGFRTILCFRPDGEAPDQSDITAIEQATTEAGMAFAAIPVRTGTVPDADQIARTRQALDTLPGPVVGYCRSGTRAAHIWALAEAGKRPVAQIVAAAEKAGVDVSALRPRLEGLAASSPEVSSPAGSGTPRRDAAHFQVLIIGGGAGGLSAAGSLLRRNRNLSIGVVEPSNEHFYQPGWTLVGGGVFRAAQTRRKEADVMPRDVVWVKQAAKLFRPDVHEVVLGDGSVVSYDALIVATGITLNWDAIPGLAETLGKNGVTSNYRFDLAPYTWQLVQQLKGGTAIFTQPPMPIKCAGAPQKAVYLSCDAWKRRGVLDGISVEFDTATPGLFGVKDFVPPLMEYIRRYHVDLQTGSKLLEVDGPNRKAIFERKVGDTVERVERSFDMLHVVPPQSAPQIIRESALAGADGFVEVNPATLQHVRFPNVFAIGDVIGTSSAKTAAAARVQAPVVATNVLAFLKHQAPVSEYEGYGACPLTVENGRIVLAEFQYGGKLAPTMPKWLLNGQQPTRLAWWLKKYVMPLMYWDGMLKGRELMVTPKPLIAKKGG